MNTTLKSSILALTLASCSTGLFQKGGERTIQHYSEKMEFVELINKRYPAYKIYLADSLTKQDMWKHIEPFKRIQFIYADIDTLVDYNSGLSFLGEGLTAENLEVRKALCRTKEICSFDKDLEIPKDSLIFISEPQIYILNKRPVAFMILKSYQPKTIQLKESDTTFLLSKFHLKSAIWESNEWKGNLTVDLD
ncbi:hypothetical protein [Croceimicrobium sp.]|uniref:hypothetical protein n=1 Tax=Croceimicrobium sp. TaxID=2828340 RepID=UPI003BACA8E0